VGGNLEENTLAVAAAEAEIPLIVCHSEEEYKVEGSGNLASLAAVAEPTVQRAVSAAC